MINRILEGFYNIDPQEMMTEEQRNVLRYCTKIVQEVAKEYGWIPVEVAMPENGERVLTTDHLNNYHLFRVLEGVFVDECCQIINENHQRYYPPVAWQRITPYQKGE